MGKLLLGRKSKFNLNDGACEIPLRNGMYVTLVFKNDVNVANLAVRLASAKAGVNNRDMLRVIFDEKKFIKEDVYDENKILKEAHNNFNKKVRFLLKRD